MVIIIKKKVLLHFIRPPPPRRPPASPSCPRSGMGYFRKFFKKKLNVCLSSYVALISIYSPAQIKWC